MTVLFESQFVACVARVVASGGPIVVTFSHWHGPGDRHRLFGEALFVRHGINAIHVRNGGNNWYAERRAQPDYRLMCALIARFPLYRAASARVGYGGSMGGYGALRFRRELGLDRVVAVTAQFSIDRRKVPWEQRWGPEAAAIDFEDGVMPRVSAGETIDLIYDTLEDLDRRHAELIDPGRHARHIAFPFAGHLMLDYLKDVGVAGDLAVALVRGDDARPLIAAARARRRTSVTFWRVLATYWAARDRTRQALWATAKGLALRPDDPELLVLRTRLATAA